MNARVLLDIALKYPAFHVRSASSLSEATLKAVQPEFNPLAPSAWTQYSSLTDASYTPGSWVPLRSARENFAFGGPEGFDQWVLGALMISPAEAYKTHNTTSKARTASHCACSSVSLATTDLGQVHIYVFDFQCMYMLHICAQILTKFVNIPRFVP